MHNNVNIDLVPGVRHANSSDHWLYVFRSGRERTQTNIDKHIGLVKNSGRINEIKAIKIWASNHSLDFPSIYLESVVLKALTGYGYNLGYNTTRVLEYLRDELNRARFVDPANSANILSDELTSSEKQQISNQASQSLAKPYWENIIW